MEAPAARRQLRAVSVKTVELVGTKTLKILVMVNTKTKFPRGIEAGLSVEVSEASSEISLTSNCLESDQVISKSTYDGESERAPGPGLKLREIQASSGKHQAPSTKRQA